MDQWNVRRYWKTWQQTVTVLLVVVRGVDALSPFSRSRSVS